MSQAIKSQSTAEDKATMKSLGFAVFCMCLGALGLIAIAIIVGKQMS